MRYPPSILDDIRARLPVSQVVGRRVQLKRRGREFVGLSPFKTERTPSFTVNDAKGFFHCFASSEHGDIFGFVMKTEGLSFVEAVERLAAEAGVVLPKPTAEAAEQEDARDKLQAEIEEATRFFEAMLAGPRGRETREYLDKRGVPAELAKRFRMGFAPDSRSALKEHLTARNFTAADMIETGLLIAGEDIPTPYDRFRGRLIIPITDLRGKVIAFGGRALAPDAKPKYLNSPETPLFHKGSVLFNANAARKAAHDSGEIVVVEGYMDVVALAGGGIENAVAPLGTALTDNQLDLLWRMSAEPTICLDGDAAGQKAALRAADLALPHIQPGRSLKFAFLPGGLDPDDLMRRDGVEAMRKVLSDTSPLIDVLWRRERDAEPLDTPERKAGFERRLAALAKRVADPALAAQYGHDLRERAKDILWRNRRNGGGGQPAAGNRRDASGRQADWRTREIAQNRRKPGLPPLPRAMAREELLRHGVARLSGEVGLAREAIILRTLLNHPFLLDEMAEEIADIHLANGQLAAMRDAILASHAGKSPLDSAELATHLSASGHKDTLGLIERAITHKAVRFAEADAADHDVRMGFRDALAEQHKAELLQALKAAEHLYMHDGSDTAWAQLLDIQNRLRATDARMAADLSSGGGL